MHRPSLKKSVLKPACPNTRGKTDIFFQRGNPSAKVSYLVSQALFCQSGKSVQVKNKALALRNSKEHMKVKPISCESSQKLNWQLTPMLTSDRFLLKKAKCDSLRGHRHQCSVLLTACVAMTLPCKFT